MKLKLFITSLILLSLTTCAYAQEGLRTMFLNNHCVICGINIRNFNSKDTNGNGIIDNGEESGNFINAIERLDEIKSLGINTLHVLPITPAGKLKALGTAGSLYAISDFTLVNEQLVDKTSKLNGLEQAKLFVKECHKRGIKVIIDLPSCGSYDLFLKRPELFIKDDKQLSIVPTDWTDVRLLKTGNNEKLNQDLIDEHKKFVDMVLDMGADGIRADVATIKPSKFWEEIIDYTRGKNPEFLYLAEASDSWREPPSEFAEFTPYDKLLEAGFDGYYGSFFGLKDWKTSNQLIEHVKFNKKLLSSYNEGKSAILSFTTHDEVSPIVLYGKDFSNMICWLEATLPYNPYIIDGFPSGDDYIYPWANEKAPSTQTDDDYYFVHRGKIDIFNFSRKPGGKYSTDFKKAADFRSKYLDIVTLGNFVPIKTDLPNIFAYARCYEGKTIVVIGNLDHEKEYKKVTVRLSGLNKRRTIEFIKGKNDLRYRRRKIYTDLAPSEIKVLLINNFSI